MNICKNCFHNGICKGPMSKNESCVDFVDKDKVFLLPCKIGDKVYRRRKNGNSLAVYNADLLWIVSHIEEFGVNCSTNIDDLFPKLELVSGEEIKKRAKEKGVFVYQIATAMGISEPTMTRKMRIGFTQNEAETIYDIILKLSELKGGAE